ncbi:hypothetical protein CH063_13827 [Colletotrichum higginsianum]|uniref:Uncharacterized protein n=1 Tax=Colletotrichum higginsianum (strain IMI 349063) TaxID=759273 RepID=H1VW06_COLHI|nr:hypothetical protein CH063_13827 [Colletotrichum higginsianum]
MRSAGGWPSRLHGAPEEGGREGGVQEAGVDVVDDVVELEEQGLRLPPEREVRGDVLGPGPGDAARRGLGGGGGEEVDVAEVGAAPAVELAAADLDGEVDDDVVEVEAPGRRVGPDEGVAVAVGELVVHEGDRDGLVGGGAGREEDRLGDLERFQQRRPRPRRRGDGRRVVVGGGGVHVVCQASHVRQGMLLSRPWHLQFRLLISDITRTLNLELRAAHQVRQGPDRKGHQEESIVATPPA